MLDIHAAIEPGKAAAGLSIGEPVATLSKCGQPTKKVLGGGLEFLDFGTVLVWTNGGVIKQIGVRGEYDGRVSGSAIGIGSTIQQVESSLGSVVEDDQDNLIVVHVAGLCFETEAWRGGPGGETVENNLDAKLTEIFVFADQTS